MAKRAVTSLVAGLVLGAATLLAGGASAEQVNLKLGDFQSLTHIVTVEGTARWMERVKELTNGEVTFTHFPAEQAAPAKGLLDAVGSGVLDVALIGALYHSDRLPLNSVVGLPGFYTTAAQGSAAIQQLVAEGPLHDELVEQGVMPIYGFVLPPYQILMKSKRVGGKDDWAGLNIRTAGPTQALIARALGAVGVSIPGPDVYSAVERGRVDGVLFPLPSVPAYNLQEVSKYISTNGSFGGYSFVMVVRKELYDSLPESVQKAMLQAGAEISAHVAEAQDQSIVGFTAEWQKQGVEIYGFTDAELTSINDALVDVNAEWVTRVGAQNPKAQEVLDAYKAANAQ